MAEEQAPQEDFILVEAPDGDLVEFPSSMSNEEIGKAMGELYPAPAPSHEPTDDNPIGIPQPTGQTREQIEETRAGQQPSFGETVRQRASERFGEAPLGTMGESAVRNIGAGGEGILDPVIRGGANALELLGRGFQGATGAVGGVTEGALRAGGMDSGQAARAGRDMSNMIDAASLVTGNPSTVTARSLTRGPRQLQPFAGPSNARLAANRAKRNIEIFDELGVTPKISTVTKQGGRLDDAARALERQTASVPLGGGATRRAARRNIDELRQARNKITGTDVGIEQAGTSVKEGLDRFLDTGMSQQADEAYGAAFRGMPKGLETEIDTALPSTRGVVKGIREGLRGSGASATQIERAIPGEAGAKLRNILEGTTEGPTNLQGLRDLRTQIGGLRGTTSEAGEKLIGDRALKQLYGSLTDDIGDIVKKGGGDVNALKAADDQYGLMAQRAKDFRKITGKEDPAAIVNKVQNLTSGKNPNRRQVQDIMGSLKADEANDLRSYLAGTLGERNTSQGFTPGNLARDIEKLGPRLDDIYSKPQASALRRIGTAAKELEGAEKLAKGGRGLFSLLGQGSVIAGGAGLISPWTVAATIGGPAVMSRILTSPGAARGMSRIMSAYAKLNDTGRAARGGAKNVQNQMRGYGNALNNMVRSMKEDEMLKPYADEFAEKLQLQDEQAP